MAHVTWVTCLITEFLNPFSHLLYPTVCLYQTALSGDKSAFRGKPTVSYYFQNCPTVIFQCWTPILNYLKPLDITLVLRNCRWIGSNADHFENYPTVYSWAVAVLFAPKLLGLTSFACFTAYGWGTHTFQKSAHGIFFSCTSSVLNIEKIVILFLKPGGTWRFRPRLFPIGQMVFSPFGQLVFDQ